MVRNFPILATVTVLLVALLFWRVERDDSGVPVADDTGTSLTAPSLPGGADAAPKGKHFASLPRHAQTATRFQVTAGGTGTWAEEGSSRGAALQEASVGHHLIPPEIRRMTSAGLRERMPPETRARLVRYERDLRDFEPRHRRYFCWSPDTAPEVVEAFRRVEVAAGLAPGPVRALAFQFVGGGHWSATATDGGGVAVQGLPVTVTWSIAPDGTITPGDGNPDAPSDLRAWLHGLYPGGSTTGPAANQPWFPLFQEAMDDLSAQSGLNLIYEPNDDGADITLAFAGRGELGVRGDIRITARDIDGNGGTLAFAYSPSFGDIVLESDDSFYDNKSNNSRRLVNVLTHEAGHSLGLGHVCPDNDTKLMEPTIITSFRGARFDETYSLQRQYGDELEVHPGNTDNDNPANATPITLSQGNSFTRSDLSIDDNSDVDYLSFSAAAGDSITLRAIPSDPIAPGDPNNDTYLEGGESGGSCSSGTPFDPTSQQNLTVEILDTNGSTVLAVADGQPAGETEELSEISLPADGTYFFRIDGGNADASQLYEFQAEIVGALATVTLTNLNTVFNGTPQGAAVTTDPAGLATTVTYDGSPTLPTGAGTYAVSATVTDPFYTGGASDSLVIAKAAADITLSGLEALYDGSPQPVEVATDPESLAVLLTYDDSGSPPFAVGTYAVSAMVDDTNYAGVSGAILNIGPTYLSWREGFSLSSQDPFVDDDEDGWITLAEYLFDTNPADNLSIPATSTSLDATTFSLVTPPPVSRPDAVLRGETSEDLVQWTTGGVTATGTGFSVPIAGPSRYLRLSFTYEETE